MTHDAPLAPGQIVSAIGEALQWTDEHSRHRKACRKPDDATEGEILQVFAAVADQHREFHEFAEAIARWDDTTAAMRGTQEPAADIVTLSTIHRTKGNEYSCVVYFNLSDDTAEIAEEAIEDERRVAYVAMTRAKEHLFVTTPRGRPSPFLREAALNPEWDRCWTFTLVMKRFSLRIRRLIMAHLASHDERKTLYDALDREIALRKKLT
jgi:superfamily I DNA/RNA helicase